MTEFALVVGGKFQEMRNYAERPPNIAHKNVEWYPVIRRHGEPFVGVDGDTWAVVTVDPSTLPPTVPDSVSPRQARLALLNIGKLDAANAVVAQSSDEIKIAWEFSTQIVRDDPGVIALGSMIGLDSAALDKLFISAAVL